MMNRHRHPYFEHLRAYCLSPYDSVVSGYAESREHKYRITTICWQSATSDGRGKCPSYVMKKIYEMTLDEFRKWVISIWRDEVMEDVISIERIYD